MSFTIEEVHYSEEVRKETQSIFEEHWEEISTYKDIPLAVDWDIYKVLDEQGKLLTLVARNDGELIGYVVFFIHNHTHYKHTSYAVQDILFVRKGIRKSLQGCGFKLLKMAETILRAKEVDIIQHHVKCKHDFSPFLEKLDYHFVEKIYQKRLN